MLACAHTAGAHGLDGFVITVEAAIGEGPPTLRVVGQRDGPLVAAAGRAWAAIGGCGILLPARTQLIHVGPAHYRKHARGIDLAIACALLIAHGVLPASSLDGVLAWGELEPDGRVLAVPGTLLAAETARRHGFRVLALACASEREAAPVPDLDLLLVPSLAALVAHLRGEASLPCGPARADSDDLMPLVPDGPETIGAASRSSLALELMLAGGHHLLALTTGLVVNERGLASLLPTLTREEAIELTKIHDQLAPTRLLRAPHVRRASGHTSARELFGGGYPGPRPGEVSLADRGVLVLDDLLELANLDTLRRVLEDRSISHDGARFPARFRLLASSASASQVPAGLRERFDLIVRAGCLVIHPGAGRRIAAARARQRGRLAATPWSCNAEIPRTGDAVRYLCPSVARVEHDPRVVRVAQTLADLDVERDESEPLDREALALVEDLVMTHRPASR